MHIIEILSCPNPMQHRKIDDKAQTMEIMVYHVNTLMIVNSTRHEATYSGKKLISEDKFWWANVRPVVGKCPPTGGKVSSLWWATVRFAGGQVSGGQMSSYPVDHVTEFDVPYLCTLYMYCIQKTVDLFTSGHDSYIGIQYN